MYPEDHILKVSGFDTHTHTRLNKSNTKGLRPIFFKEIILKNLKISVFYLRVPHLRPIRYGLQLSPVNLLHQHLHVLEVWVSGQSLLHLGGQDNPWHILHLEVGVVPELFELTRFTSLLFILFTVFNNLIFIPM